MKTPAEDPNMRITPESYEILRELKFKTRDTMRSLVEIALKDLMKKVNKELETKTRK